MLVEAGGAAPEAGVLTCETGATRAAEVLEGLVVSAAAFVVVVTMDSVITLVLTVVWGFDVV